MNGFLVYLATLHAAVYVAYSQSDSNSQFGKPCTSSYQCWRTEPISESGSPISLFGSLMLYSYFVLKYVCSKVMF
ncbi:hypothetical protein ANCCAN_15759 [Ancylostoma caninum]|uniref:Uncharacterized protein n=1 Tax=Ancylostoma caninum TaxID=29170 RepID=A0A368G6L7_ANCCA|nr:hypothetical protein ANCCAN_15759 [Ancylostoma caninum]